MTPEEKIDELQKLVEELKREVSNLKKELAIQRGGEASRTIRRLQMQEAK